MAKLWINRFCRALYSERQTIRHTQANVINAAQQLLATVLGDGTFDERDNLGRLTSRWDSRGNPWIQTWNRRNAMLSSLSPINNAA